MECVGRKPPERGGGERAGLGGGRKRAASLGEEIKETWIEEKHVAYLYYSIWYSILCKQYYMSSPILLVVQYDVYSRV